MTDTLEIFGDEFTGVTGIKATDDNDQIKTYIRPQGTKSISANGSGIDVTEYASVDVSVSGGGGVTVTDEANATGITCVITSGTGPTPPSPDIPLNTELIDYTKAVNDYAIDSNGDVISAQYYSVSDYTPVESGMTFSYTGNYWFYLAVYDENKDLIHTIYITNDATPDQSDPNIGHGTLSGSELPQGSKYVRITGNMNPDQRVLSLIRTS